MKQTGRHILAFVVLIGALWGCSTKKNTTVSRAYHNLTARYNVYFNAKQSLITGLQHIDQNIADDYSRPLPIDKGTLPEAAKVATSEMNQVIAKCNKLITLHSITKNARRKSNESESYKKFASKGEYNKWVDDSYVMMGKASYFSHDYHRAIENFNFVVRKFPNEPIRYDAYLWMARSYTETGDNKQVLEIFSSLSRDGNFPKRLKQGLSLAQAHYYLKDNEIDVAITHLKSALGRPLPRKVKLRINYILAQLLVLTDKPVEASDQFLHVLKMHPPYQMAFNAKLSRIEIGGGDTKEVEQQLKKLLDNIMNADYRDRIYFAKGKISFKEGHINDAIADLKKSVLYSSSNPKQRALSSLNLARILFEQNEYRQAASYYDTAVAVIDENYPGYAEIVTRASGLKTLAHNLNTIAREDSLQKLALMPKQERYKLINGIIEKLQQDGSNKAAGQNAQMSGQDYFRSQQQRPQMGSTANQNLWYFYNTLTTGIGKTEFQRIWGKRKLEDDWRRKNKLIVREEDKLQIADSAKKADTIIDKRKAVDPKTIAYYLQDIPLTDSLMAVSNELIKGAFFNVGRIYRTDFNDFKRSTEALEELNRRFPGSIYELPAFFDLYQQYNDNNNVSKADEYKTKIISKYPGSKYAKYLLNPRYFIEIAERKAAIEKKYDEALHLFHAYDYARSADAATATLAMMPDSALLPKVRFIEVAAKGASQERPVFANALDQYINTYPQEPVSAIAIKIRDLIKSNSLADYQGLLAGGYIKEEIANKETKRKRGMASDENESKYSDEEDMFHYYVIAFSKEARVDVSRLIYDLANYNLDYYTSTDFDIEPVILDPKTQLVVVRSLPNKEEGLIYFRSIIRKRNVFKTLKGIEYVNFLASSANYRAIIGEKSYLGYLHFFIKYYNPYFGPNIPSDELPSPEVLLTEVRKKEEQAEKGSFVLVKPTSQDTTLHVIDSNLVEYQGCYVGNPGKVYNYVIVFLKKQTDSAALIKEIDTFHQSNFGSTAKFNVEQLDDNRGILIVEGLNGIVSAREYLQKANSSTSLSELFKANNFRGLIISDENLQIFRKEKNLLSYMEFFEKLK